MIPLPLKYYDEAGTVMPPRWFYWMLAVGCRDLFLVAAFTAIPTESDRLYRIFFPHSDTLWLQLFVALPVFLVVMLMSFRALLWQKELSFWPGLMRPLCYTGILLQLAVIASFLHRTGWQFNGYMGSVALYLLTFAYIVGRSHHLSVMFKDWRQPPVIDNKK